MAQMSHHFYVEFVEVAARVAFAESDEFVEAGFEVCLPTVVTVVVDVFGGGEIRIVPYLI